MKRENQHLALGVGLSLVTLAAASLAAIAFSANAPLIRTTFGLSEVGVGAIASCIYLGAAASSLSSGRLTDTMGVGPVLVIAMLSLAAGLLVSIAAPGPLIFFAGLLVAGVGYGAVNPPTNVLANPADPRRRGLSISIKQSGIPLGGIVAGILIPPIAVAYGWRISLLVPIGVCVVLALISTRLGSMDPTVASRNQGRTPQAGIGLRHAYTYGLLMAGVQVSIFILLAVYLVDERGFGPAAAGASLAIALIGGLVGRPGWGWISDRFHHDRIRVLQAVALISAIALCLLTVTPTAWMLPVLVVMGLCSVGWNGVFLAVLNEAVPPSLIGATSGMAMLLVHLGAVVMPPVVGLIAIISGGWTIAWIVCATAALASMVVVHVGYIPRMPTAIGQESRRAI